MPERLGRQLEPRMLLEEDPGIARIPEQSASLQSRHPKSSLILPLDFILD